MPGQEDIEVTCETLKGITVITKVHSGFIWSFKNILSLSDEWVELFFLITRTMRGGGL